MARITDTRTFDTSRHDMLASLADRIRQGGIGEDRVLEGLIFHALEGHEGDWSDCFDDGAGGDVWHRRDPEDGCAFDGPPRYLTLYEDVVGLLPEGVWISQLLQSGPGGRWICVLLGTGLDLEDSTGHGPDLCRAVANACMLVRART